LVSPFELVIKNKIRAPTPPSIKQQQEKKQQQRRLFKPRETTASPQQPFIKNPTHYHPLSTQEQRSFAAKMTSRHFHKENNNAPVYYECHTGLAVPTTGTTTTMTTGEPSDGRISFSAETDSHQLAFVGGGETGLAGRGRHCTLESRMHRQGQALAYAVTNVVPGLFAQTGVSPDAALAVATNIVNGALAEEQNELDQEERRTIAYYQEINNERRHRENIAGAERRHEETQAADRENREWRQTIHQLYGEAFYHVGHHTWFLALVAFLIGITQACQKLYHSPITGFLHSMAGCHGDADHNNNNDHDSPPPPETFTSHPTMSTWYGIPDTMNSLVSSLFFAPSVAITKMYGVFRLPDLHDVHAWLVQILGCTGMGMMCTVVILVPAVMVTWILRCIPVIRDLVYPIYGILILGGLFQYFHDWRELLFLLTFVGCYGGVIGACLWIRRHKTLAKLAAQESTGRIPSCTETEQCSDEVATIRTTLTLIQAVVGIGAASWFIYNIFDGSR
jgi:hypothetical protein